MNDNRMIVHAQDREIILIGTAHVSRESIDEADRTIRETMPDMVCVELDQGRYEAISQTEQWQKLNIVKVFREGKGFLLMANLVLAGFQRRLGSELGVKPGDEMKTAVETARELGIAWSLCDREVQITLRRAWAACGLWSKSKLMASLLSGAFSTEQLSAEAVENLKQHNELDRMMNELAEYLPQVKKTLIDERDRYLAAKIWSSGGAKVLAVIGAGHLAGVREELLQLASGQASSSIEELDAIPPPSFAARIIPWLIPAFLAALIAYGAYWLGIKESLSKLLLLLMWNGGLAAAGTLIALGHPLSILAAFFGAPLATANPFIGVGLFSGLVQATIRKPRVQDMSSINDDIGSLKGIYRNRITRALLVFLLSTIGGVIGNVIAFSSIVTQVFKN